MSKIDNIFKKLASNQNILIKLAGVSEEFEKAMFNKGEYPYLNMLASNSSEFQVLMDNLGQDEKLKDRFFEENYPTLKKTESLLKRHYEEILKNLIAQDKVLKNLNFHEIADLKRNLFSDKNHVKRLDNLKSKANELFISKSDVILNKLLPRLLNLTKLKVTDKNTDKSHQFSRSVVYQRNISTINDPIFLEKLYFDILDSNLSDEEKEDKIHDILYFGNVTSKVLEHALTNKLYVWVPELVSRNPAITESIALYLATSKEENILKNLSGNDKIYQYDSVLEALTKNKTSTSVFLPTYVIFNLIDHKLDLKFVLNILDYILRDADSFMILRVLKKYPEYLQDIVNKSKNTTAVDLAKRKIDQNV